MLDFVYNKSNLEKSVPILIKSAINIQEPTKPDLQFTKIKSGDIVFASVCIQFRNKTENYSVSKRQQMFLKILDSSRQFPTVLDSSRQF